MNNLTFVSVFFVFFLLKQGFADDAFSIAISNDQGKDYQIHRKAGEFLSLNCSVTIPVKGAYVEIKWSKNGWPLDSSNTTNGWFVRKISNVTREDGGYYLCKAVLYDGETKSDGVYLNVEEKPLVITSKSGTREWFTGTPIIVSKDSKTSLRCYATGWPLPELRWFQNYTEITTTTHAQRNHYRLEKSQDNQGMTLFIFEITEKQQGVYTCLASNSYGKDFYQVEVDFYDIPDVHPKIKAVQSYVHTRHGQPNVTLTCMGTGIPQFDADVEWLYNGNPIPEKDNRLVSEIEYYDQEGLSPKVKMSLSILNITQRDSGNYTCTVYVNGDVLNDTISFTVTKSGSNFPKPHKPKILPVYIVISIVISSVVFLLAVVACVVIGCRYKRNFDKPKIPEGPFEYGVFITYSSHDYGWVQANLLPFLKDNHVETCIHYRNFDVGVLLEQNIVNCVYKSRVVIAVMSRNYLKSKYCRSELDYAIHRGIEEPDTNPLITLKIDDHIQQRQLPLAIRRKTFIDVTSDVEKDHWRDRLLLHIKGQDLNRNVVVDNEGDENEALINQNQNGNLHKI